MSRSNRPQISRGGLARSVTLTVVLAGGELYTFVAGNQRLAAERLARLPELPRRLCSVSTPDTIYADLSGDPSHPMLQPLLLACFTDPPPLTADVDTERGRTRLYAARREVAEMRGEA